MVRDGLVLRTSEVILNGFDPLPSPSEFILRFAVRNQCGTELLVQNSLSDPPPPWVLFFFQVWGRKTEHPTFEKLRFWAFWLAKSDRARREDSNASSLASKGPSHPNFEAFFVFSNLFPKTETSHSELTRCPPLPPYSEEWRNPDKNSLSKCCWGHSRMPRLV